VNTDAANRAPIYYFEFDRLFVFVLKTNIKIIMATGIAISDKITIICTKVPATPPIIAGTSKLATKGLF
jgi:hypothetical protein